MLGHNDLSGMALRQVQRHGVDVTYTEYSEGSYDPVTSSITNSTGTTYTFKAYPSQASYSESQQPNLVNVDLKVFLVAGESLSVKPKINSEISVGTQKYTILSVKEHYAHGKVVLWRILCKEG